MAGSTQSSAGRIADDLFDRYVLPKAALVLISVASFVGTAVTVRLADQWAVPLTVVKWGYFVALGVLTGGLLWKHAFVRPRDLGTDADRYCGRMYERFDRIATGYAVVLALTSVGVLYHYVSVLRRPVLTGALAGVLVVLVGLLLSQSRRTASVEVQFRSPTGVTVLGLALAAVALTAALEVVLRAGGPLDVGVRILHLLAFAVWIGGAVWNIFVAVPAGQERPTADVVSAAGQQLERFRWAVRIVIPTLALTGTYQAIDVFGYGLAAYLESLVGLAVVAKLGFVGVLVVIFRLCPMWRACSPIEGVCDIADGDRTSDETGPAGGAAPEETSDV